MKPVDQLKLLAGPIDTATLPTSKDWEEAERAAGVKLPESLKELINTFGHGTWGRDLILFHPKGAGYQRLRLENLIQLRSYVDSAFQAQMVGDIPKDWNIIPVGILPYNLSVFQDLCSEEMVLYDGDYSEELRTGSIGPAKFIVESLRWREVSLPRIWRHFAEANWPSELPIFTTNHRHEANGFFALPPPTK